MLAGVNDRYEQALALARAAAQGSEREAPIFKVNLIPFNPTDSEFEGSSRESIAAFRGALESQRHSGDGAPDARDGTSTRPAVSWRPARPETLQSCWRTDRMLPAGSLNQAISGPPVAGDPLLVLAEAVVALELHAQVGQLSRPLARCPRRRS